jgi:hypothetical protein
MIDEFEVIVTQYKYYPSICLEGAEEDDENTQYEHPVSLPRFELRTSKIKFDSVISRKTVRHIILIRYHELSSPKSVTNFLYHMEQTQPATCFCLFLLVLIFVPEDGDEMFLRNTG